MVKSQQQEFRAKVIPMGGTVRGWIPAPLTASMGGRLGDYMVFRIDATGKAQASIHRPTASEKRKAALRKTKRA